MAIARSNADGRQFVSAVRLTNGSMVEALSAKLGFDLGQMLLIPGCQNNGVRAVWEPSRA